jgi:hypothetical protein
LKCRIIKRNNIQFITFKLKWNNCRLMDIHIDEEYDTDCSVILEKTIAYLLSLVTNRKIEKVENEVRFIRRRR